VWRRTDTGVALDEPIDGQEKLGAPLLVGTPLPNATDNNLHPAPTRLGRNSCYAYCVNC
jgi:hypothetical protein